MTTNNSNPSAETFHILHTLNGRKTFYFDPFKGGVFTGTKSESNQVCFMLNDQMDGSFEVVKQ